MNRDVGFILTGLVLGGLTLAAVAVLDIGEAPGDNAAAAAHAQARDAFLADLPDTACLRAAEIARVARARGWAAVQDPAFDWCVAPETVQTWLRVTVEPPLPFSTRDENAQIFAFDSAGCAVDWSYASGPGSTCAD
ncbi:MAG: hypothetical protein ACE369_11135 [Roseovarius sp.]